MVDKGAISIWQLERDIGMAHLSVYIVVRGLVAWVGVGFEQQSVCLGGQAATGSVNRQSRWQVRLGFPGRR